MCLNRATGGLPSIIGPPGSDKLTLTNIFGLLNSPTSGSYVLDGRDLYTVNDREPSVLRDVNFGFAFRTFDPWGRLTAENNVALPPVRRGLGGVGAPAPHTVDPRRGGH